MSETECRHMPRPAWNPARCAKCGAMLEEPANARLIRAAKALRGSVYDCLEQVSDSLSSYTAATLEHGVNRLDDAIAEAERGVSWLNGEPSVTVHRLKDVQADWRVEFAGPIPEPAGPAAEGERPSLVESFEALREASRGRFDEIEDVAKYVDDLRGE